MNFAKEMAHNFKVAEIKVLTKWKLTRIPYENKATHINAYFG